MSQSLRDYKRACLPKNGGNKAHIVLILPSEVEGIANANLLPLEAPSIDTPTLVNGVETYLIEADRRTVEFNEVEVDSDSGSYFQQEIAWVLSPMTPEQIDLRNRLRNRRVHALVTDNATKRTRIVQFATATTSNKTNRTRGERNAAQWNLKTESKFQAPYLDTDWSIGNVDPVTGQIILIHTPDSSRWLLTVNGVGSLVTTRISSTAGQPTIPIGNNYALSVDTSDGSLGTNPP